MSRSLLGIGILLIWVSASLPCASSAPPTESEAQLLARLVNEHDPVKKSREETRLAQIKLQQAIHACNQGNVEQGKQLVNAYLGRIKDSWQILKSSGPNASRKPQAYKDLDIALREDARLLSDLINRVSYFDRAPLEKTEKEVELVRAEVLVVLFPAAGTAGAPEAAKPPAKTD